MRKNILNDLFILFILLQSVSVIHAEVNISDDLTLTEIIFEEKEPGLENFTSRLLLGKDVLRLDDGQDQGDFILFFRNTREIHSFNHEDKLHLVMKPLTSERLDFKVRFKIEKKELLDAPKINGIIPVEHQFFADNQLCKKSINIAGFLTEITKVLINYDQVIVQQNKQTFSEIPASVRSSCYMANNYLFTNEYLKAGFPLFVIDDQGRQKKLLTFQQVKKNKTIMQPPEGYSLYYPNSANLNN